MKILYHGGTECWYACVTNECHGVECEDCKYITPIEIINFLDENGFYTYNLRLNIPNIDEAQPI